MTERRPPEDEIAARPEKDSHDDPRTDPGADPLRSTGALDIFEADERQHDRAERLGPETGLETAVFMVEPSVRERLAASGSRASSPSPEPDSGGSVEDDILDAEHFLGLAQLYEARGDSGSALECLQLARQRCPTLAATYAVKGRMLARRHDWDAAARELERARQCNPFDPDVVELLGRVEYERADFLSALEATIDAFLLLADERSSAASSLRRRMRTLKRALKWENRQLIAAFHARRESLDRAFSRIKGHRETLIRDRNVIEGSILFTGAHPKLGPGRIEMAGKLREIDLLSTLPDETVFLLTDVMHEETFEESSVVFGIGSDSRDMFLIREGEVELSRPTPYGDFPLRSLPAGEMFGENNFVSSAVRTCQATTSEGSRLVRCDAEKLDELISGRPDLGVHLYSALWHALAQKVRSSSTEMTRLIADYAGPASAGKTRPAFSGDTTSERRQIDLREKLSLFREQGLNHRELLTIATFSQERMYPVDSWIYREGEVATEMFVVLEGRVRLSKFIPGAGEEAIEVLGRGDFFGEIALIDGRPRSADARPHEGPATALAIDHAALREVLSMDAQASLDFLRLMCRILASRLRELEEKLITWEILAQPSGGLRRRGS